MTWPRSGQVRAGWLLVSALAEGQQRDRYRWLLECVECGARCERSGSWVRSGLHACEHPLVDEMTTYADDRIAQTFAARGGMKLEEIAATIGVTRERVRQIEAVALRKLRRACEREGLDAATVIEHLKARHDRGTNAPEDAEGAGVNIGPARGGVDDPVTRRYRAACKKGGRASGRARRAIVAGEDKGGEAA